MDGLLDRLTHSPLEIFPKNTFRSWSLSCYKDLKLTTKLFTGHTLCGLLIQMQNIGWQSSHKCRKQNFVTLDFYLQLSLLPSFFAFLASFFSLAGHLVGFILVGDVLSKERFRILGLDESKGRQVAEQDFHGNFQVNVIWFNFCLFLPVSLTELCLFWQGLKDRFTLYKLVDKVILEH